MSAALFAQHLKALRQRTGLTLREFCQKHGFDPGNLSRLERGQFLPPHSEDALARYAEALGLERGSSDWIEFFDIAAATRGELPHDLMTDEELLPKLPMLFRTLRGTPIAPDKLDALVEDIRRN